MPDGFQDLALTQSIADVRRIRGALRTVSDDPQKAEDPTQWVTLEESSTNGARVRYRFFQDRLVELQILSILPDTSAVPPHLAAMNERYGPPNRILDCPEPIAYPSRRFVWDRSPVAVADAFLLYGERVSVTWSVMSRARMFGSLSRGRCRVISADALERFPVAPRM